MYFKSCTIALCPDPLDIDNGTVTFTGNSVGDTATYTCNSGFGLIGGATTTCTEVDMNSAAFQPAPPSCRREYTVKCKDIQGKVVLILAYSHTTTYFTVYKKMQLRT